jgi:hypothetical protein
MSTEIKRGVFRALLLLLAMIVIVRFWRSVTFLIGHLFGLSMFLVSVSVLPLALLALGWFLYSVWGKPYFRAWHINHLRNARLLKEAAGRRETAE